MKNRCQKIQFRILENSSLSADELRHLETCTDCRTFAAFAKRMEQLPMMEQDVPAFLDEAVLRAASKAVPKPNWRPFVWKITVPFAAAFAFAAGVLMYQPKLQEETFLPDHSAAIARNIMEYNLMEESFDEQVISLAIDVGSEMISVSESLDSVTENTDYYI